MKHLESLILRERNTIVEQNQRTQRERWLERLSSLEANLPLNTQTDPTNLGQHRPPDTTTSRIDAQEKGTQGYADEKMGLEASGENADSWSQASCSHTASGATHPIGEHRVHRSKNRQRTAGDNRDRNPYQSIFLRTLLHDGTQYDT